MKKTYAALAVMALTLGVAASASAQTSQPTGLSLRLGLFFPSDSDARDESASMFAIGLDYKLRDVTSREMVANSWMSSWVVSIDHFGAGGFSSTPILVNYVGRRDSFYLGAGAGVGFNKTFDGDSEPEFMFQVSAGYEFPTMGSNPFFVEGRYWGGNNNLAGLAVYGGIRF
jgi:hypothetical protein